MCGIAGLIRRPEFVDRSISQTILDSLLSKMSHRGPDDVGYLTFFRGRTQVGRQVVLQTQPFEAALLHRRLSILDLHETGWQPMGTPDRNYHIVFNGEIYNYLELRSELELLGHVFKSQSDTEVLLVGFAQWGSGVFSRLVGMFACGILDCRKRRVTLARDFFGIKPLFYAVTEQGLAFASEIKVLLEIPGMKRIANQDKVFQYLQNGVTDHGSDTMFSGIQQLQSAHYVEVALDDPCLLQPKCFWTPQTTTRNDLSFDEAANLTRDLFLESIELHLRSDVPVGAALSGGIDSSSIVMAMRYLHGDTLDLHTFSYVPEDPVLSEEHWIDMVGRASGATVHKVRPTPEELVADMARLIYVQEEPFVSTSVYAQYRLFQLARETGVKVMLDGQGADEIFGGYKPFVAARLASLVRSNSWWEAARFYSDVGKLQGGSPKFLLPRVAEFLLPPGVQAMMRRFINKKTLPCWINGDWFAERSVISSLSNYTRGTKVMRDHLYRSLTETSLPHLLRYEDRNSMASSIESRVPFLTPALVSTVLSLPEEYLVDKNGTTKALFRRAMRGIVPDAVLDRKDKVGFSTPEHKWLSTMAPWVEEVLRGDLVTCNPMVNAQALKQALPDILNGKNSPMSAHLWRLVNLVEWARQFDVSLW